MKGYWHIAAIMVTIGSLVIVMENKLFLIVIFLWLMYLFKKKRLRKTPIFISLTFLLIFLFYLPSLEEPDEKPQKETSSSDDFYGHVVSPIQRTDEIIQFRFKDEQTKDVYQVVNFQQEHVTTTKNLHYGAYCQVHGQIEIPNHSTNPGEFDYRKYLLLNGVYYQLNVESIVDINCQESSALLNRVYLLRDAFRTYIQQTWSTTTAAWMQALVFGDDSYIPEETIELFQRWSLSHILAISGLHIGLVVTFIYLILLKCNILTKEKSQWFIMLFLPIYAILAGGEPSVWRASLMVILVILLSKIKLKYRATDIISIVFLILLFMNPYMIYNIGFQFSFLVTFSIILSKKWIIESNVTFFQMLKISFISQMIIIPLQVSYFHSIQPLSILLNLLVIPYYTLFVIPLLFLMLIISPLSLIVGKLDFLFRQVHEKIFITTLNYIDDMFYYPWMIGDFPHITFIIIYYILLFLMMFLIYQKKLKKAFISGIVLTLLLFLITLRPYFLPYGTVTMLDIGQGDAFIIELPYRKGVIFIDAGAQFSFTDQVSTNRVYKRIIKPFLSKKGITEIDAIFLSHEDTDHVGSVDYMVEELNVKQIFISRDYQLPKDQEKHWVTNGAQLRRTATNQVITIGSQPFHVLGVEHHSLSENDQSMIIYTQFGGNNWLFTGDIGVEIEKQLMETYPNLKVDVLKVAHHGSHTSTDPAFISQIEPTYALVSVGRNNMYGHPAREVLDTLRMENISILRTDQDGAIIYRFKGNNGTFYQYMP